MTDMRCSYNPKKTWINAPIHDGYSLVIISNLSCLTI